MSDDSIQPGHNVTLSAFVCNPVGPYGFFRDLRNGIDDLLQRIPGARRPGTFPPPAEDCPFNANADSAGKIGRTGVVPRHRRYRQEVTRFRRPMEVTPTTGVVHHCRFPRLLCHRRPHNPHNPHRRPTALAHRIRSRYIHFRVCTGLPLDRRFQSAAAIMGIVPTRDDGGYWLDASDGGVFGLQRYAVLRLCSSLGLHPQDPDSQTVSMLPSWAWCLRLTTAATLWWLPTAGSSHSVTLTLLGRARVSAIFWRSSHSNARCQR